jgi:hypothetical protein
MLWNHRHHGEASSADEEP